MEKALRLEIPVFAAAIAAALSCGCRSTPPLPPLPPAQQTSELAASEWEISNASLIAGATSPDEIRRQLAAGPRAMDALLASVKPGYSSDPLRMYMVGAATQYVMTPPGAGFRREWCAALERRAAAAERDGFADVAWICRDQLRWCGPHDAAVPPQPPDGAFAPYPGPERAKAGDVLARLKTYDRKDKQTPADLRGLKTDEIAGSLDAGFPEFSVDGKYLVLQFLRDRESPLARKLALQAAGHPNGRLSRLAESIVDAKTGEANE